MSIKIGGKTFAIRKPADLDGDLLTATGFNAAETAAQLRQGGYASHIARALHPFLADKDAAVQDVAAHIGAQDDLAAVRGDVLKLYEADEKPAPAKTKPAVKRKPAAKAKPKPGLVAGPDVPVPGADVITPVPEATA